MEESVDAGRLDAAESQRLRDALAISAAGIGTFDWDLTTGWLDCDDRMTTMFGFDAHALDRSIDTFTAFTGRIHPADKGQVTEALQAAIDSCGDFESLYRVRLPSGDIRWISSRGRALGDPSGTAVRLLGAASDVTSQHEAEHNVTQVLEAMPAAFFSLNRHWEFTYVNAHAEELLQPVSAELVGQVIWEEFPAALGSPIEAHYRHAMDSGETATFEAYYPAPLDAWFQVLAWPSPDGLAVYFLNITDRRRQQERLQLLSAVTDQLTGTMQPELAVARLAELVVPALADWCIVTLVDTPEHTETSRRHLRDVGWWHRDEDARPLLEAYARTRIPAMRDDSFLLKALSTGERVVHDAGATTAIQAMFVPGKAHDLIGRLAPDAFVVLPLRGRDRTVGLLTLFNGPDHAPITAEELITAGEVASRAGLALDNARLYRQQRLVAEGLQRSLLTDPPQPDHGQIVVRYLPAVQATQVGGDWYDAFIQPGGTTMLVIGDVVGHDTAAAAIMGQLRSLLRGIASYSDARPAEVLRGLDAAMESLMVSTLATAAAVRFEQTPDEVDQGVTRMVWANAGHPPPLVLHPDGTVALLADARGDLLLGVDPRAVRREHEATLARGSTVLLYTDGLVERRDAHLDDGLDRLVDAVTELAGASLDELVDGVLERMVRGQPDDDVALVAVRLHRQDQPRPAEAGPNMVPPSLAAPRDPVQ